VLGFISVFWSGMLWAWIYEKTGSLLPSMFAHAANNLLVCLSILYLLRA
jgi:membrane protease YdiL (CAAX protease family)